MADITTTVSYDTFKFLYPDPSYKVVRGLEDGSLSLHVDSFDIFNGNIKGSSFFDLKNRSRLLCRTYSYTGRDGYYRHNAIPTFSGWAKTQPIWIAGCPSWLSFTFAGLNNLKYEDNRARRRALETILNHIKTDKNAYIQFSRIDIAFDIEADANTTIDQFFALKFAKSQRINSPFKFFVNNGDGSRTYYIEKKTKSGKKSIVRAYFYEKDHKEGSHGGKRQFRFEVSVDGLNKVGSDPEKVIKRLENVLKQYRLFLFEDIDSCNEFKKQYAENIDKDRSDNVPQKLLREIEHGSTSIQLELTDELKRWIYNALDNTYRADPPPIDAPYSRRKVDPDRIKNCRIRQGLEKRWNSVEPIPIVPAPSRRKVDPDRIKNCRIRQGLEKRWNSVEPIPIVPAPSRRKVDPDRIKNCRIRQGLRRRWKRERIERVNLRERRNRQGIRARIESLQQCDPNHYQLDVLVVEDDRAFYTPTFYVYATGPPMLVQQLEPLVWQHQLLSFELVYVGSSPPI